MDSVQLSTQLKNIHQLEIKMLIILLGIWVGTILLDVIFRKLGIPQHGYSKYGKIIKVINERKYEVEYKRLGLFTKTKIISLRYCKMDKNEIKISKIRFLVENKNIRFFKIKNTLDPIFNTKIKHLSDIKNLIINIYKYEPTYRIDILDMDNANPKLPKMLQTRTNLSMYLIDKNIVDIETNDMLGYCDTKTYLK